MESHTTDSRISKIEATTILRNTYPNMSDLELRQALLNLSFKSKEILSTDTQGEIRFRLSDLTLAIGEYWCLKSLAKNYFSEYLNFDQLYERPLWKKQSKDDILNHIKELATDRKLRIYSSKNFYPSRYNSKGEREILKDWSYGEEALRLIDQERNAQNLQAERALFKLEEILNIEDKFFTEEQKAGQTKEFSNQDISIDCCKGIMAEYREAGKKIPTKKELAERVLNKAQHKYSTRIGKSTVMRHLSGKNLI